jgi:hypothetical protein
MLCEYAVEPALLNNWKDFRYFIEKFGVTQGRLISRYPKRWKKMVYESLTGCGEIERKRIEDRLQTLDDRMLKRQHEWAPQLDWLTNAETEHSRRPFRAILAKTNPNQRGFVLEGDSLDETHSLWNVSRSRIVSRAAQEMAACVAPLLRVCKEVLFIDPHFGPENLRHRRPLEEFLAVILKGRDGVPPTRIEIHTSDKAETLFFKNECEQRLPDTIPEGMRIRLVRWHQRDVGEKLHNRFILTDMGGVRFGVGLDDGAEGETDEVELLGDATYKFLWAQYTSDPAFDFVDELVVEGRRALHGGKVL